MEAAEDVKDYATVKLILQPTFIFLCLLNRMKDPILKLSKNKTPLLMFESGISGENEIPLLCCDNEQMGRDMAQAMII